MFCAVSAKEDLIPKRGSSLMSLKSGFKFRFWHVFALLLLLTTLALMVKMETMLVESML